MKTNKGSEFETSAAMDVTGKNSQLIANHTDIEFQKKLRKKDAEMHQLTVTYNKDLINATDDSRFKHKIFVGNTIVVRLEKTDFLVPSEIDGMHTINPLCWIQVQTPDYPQGKWIMNPLPYNYRGVVVAVGDEVIRHRKEANLMPLEVGDVVELNWFDLKQLRYYPDKNKIDLIDLATPYAPNFEGFAKVPAQFVETIIKRSELELVLGCAWEEQYDEKITEEQIIIPAAPAVVEPSEDSETVEVSMELSQDKPAYKTLDEVQKENEDTSAMGGSC